DGSSQVVAVGSDGNVYHETRLPNASWTGFAPLDGVGTPKMHAFEVAIAGLPNGTSQVLAIGDDHRAYSRDRLTDGTWTAFGPTPGHDGATSFPAQRVAVTALPDGSTQVLATTL
ncbi:hypothetical protein, partial [Kitasatospora griseola]|uniref:hypothetical protein n=1 Tax=Kitasatospora griseola TaxID=2064 RepID=UPI003806705A